MTKLSALFLLSLLAIVASESNFEECVLEEDGTKKCAQSEALSMPAVRQAGGMPCQMNDMKCWCILAVKYTNDVRRRNGQTKKLKVGPVSQLENAVEYAKELGRLGGLTHQNLGAATRDVGCKRFIGGENIALNYERVDLAKKCLDQWEGSSGHLQNIVGDRFEDVVVGFHVTSSGRVYCVQTFSYVSDYGTVGNVDDKDCEAVSGGGGGPSPRPSVTSSPIPSQVGTIATPTPSPTAGTPVSSRRAGRKACRCLALGDNCTQGTAMKTGNQCIAGRMASEQPASCRMKCCEFCTAYPGSNRCQNSGIQSLCRNASRR